jgi:MFS superfamily sulfate permease-like transporter
MLLSIVRGILTANQDLRYIFYYIPFFNWITQYKWAFFWDDFIAALTVASFYIPMSLSYASNLGHIPPVNGLYSFVFNPVIYAILGTSPLMVVGPEAAGSLLTGQVVRENINQGRHEDDDQTANAQIAGAVTFMAGGVILAAGVFRLGFLDNVLSRPFLRGFISAIGIVIFIDQLIPEMGLSHLAAQVGGIQHGSCVDKAVFLVQNMGKAHGLTTAVSFGSFAIIMVFRYVSSSLSIFSLSIIDLIVPGSLKSICNHAFHPSRTFPTGSSLWYYPPYSPGNAAWISKDSRFWATLKAKGNHFPSISRFKSHISNTLRTLSRHPSSLPYLASLRAALPPRA